MRSPLAFGKELSLLINLTLTWPVWSRCVVNHKNNGLQGNALPKFIGSTLPTTAFRNPPSFARVSLNVSVPGNDVGGSKMDIVHSSVGPWSNSKSLRKLV